MLESPQNGSKTHSVFLLVSHKYFPFKIENTFFAEKNHWTMTKSEIR